LDYERENQYVFTLHSPTNPNLNVVINVRDNNDNIPTLALTPQLARITTNFPISSLVAVARAKDADKGSRLTYSIVSGNPAGNFMVDSDTGIVRVAQCLRYSELGLQAITIGVDDGRFVANQTLQIQIFRPTDNSFENSCGLDCNPITFSITSTADGNMTFTNVEKNGRILNSSELLAIVSGGDSSNTTDYKDLEKGIAFHLRQSYAEKYELQQLNVIELTVVDATQQQQSQQEPASNKTVFLNAKYVFEVHTTNATITDLNPIKQNETYTIIADEGVIFKLQTSPEWSTVSGKYLVPINNLI